MKRALPALALVALFASCEYHTDDPGPPPPVVETAIIRDVDYVKNTYFYFADPRAFIGPRFEDPQIEVYRTVTQADLVAHPDIIRFPGWVIAETVGDGQAIRDVAAMINAGVAPPDSLALDQEFELLTFGVDYDFMIDARTNQAVGIHLVSPIPDSALKALAVKYINIDGMAVGGSYATLVAHHAPDWPDTLMLKMLKHPDPRPQGPYGSVWRLAVRNVYYLGWTGIQPGSLKIVIMDVLNTTRLRPTTPEGSGVDYLRIFGVDQVDNKTGSGRPDGLLDPWFVDFEHGLLVFPSIEGFAPDPADVNQWTDGEFAFTGQYQAQYDTSMTIYTQLLNPTQEQDHHQYDIHATRTIPAP